MQNWRTTLSGIGAAFMAMLGAVSALPYELGEASILVPPEWKQRVAIAGFVSAFILRVVQSIMAADAKPPDPKP